MLRPTVTQGIGEGNVNETTNSYTGKENRASPSDPHLLARKAGHLQLILLMMPRLKSSH